MSSQETKYPPFAARATDRKAAKMLELLATVEDAMSDRVRKRMLMSKARQSDSLPASARTTPH
jgi:hypothetical protein